MPVLYLVPRLKITMILCRCQCMRYYDFNVTIRMKCVWLLGGKCWNPGWDQCWCRPWSEALTRRPSSWLCHVRKMMWSIIQVVKLWCGRCQQAWQTLYFFSLHRMHNCTCRVLISCMRYCTSILMWNKPETGEIFEVDERRGVAELQGSDSTGTKNNYSTNTEIHKIK